MLSPNPSENNTPYLTRKPERTQFVCSGFLLEPENGTGWKAERPYILEVEQVVIFLDIDGVICTELSTRLSGLLRLPLERQIFDPRSLFWLRWLVRHSGARIVLCSSWRDALTVDDPLCRAFIQNLYRRLERNGTPIWDAAPQVGDKGEDIQAWLAERPQMQYVVLDDHDCFGGNVQARSRWIPIPEGRGLRRREAEAAANCLHPPG